MRVDNLSLYNFRNFKQLELPLTGRIVGFVGDNGHGKTNVLEAAYMLSTGTSWRTSHHIDVMHEEAVQSKVQGRLSGEDEVDLSVGIVRESLGSHLAKMRYFVNGIPRTRQVFAGTSPAVVFAPEDLQAVIGAPTLRRQILDRLLSVCDRMYGYHLRQYGQILTRRNRLLVGIREGEIDESMLLYWTEKMIMHGSYLLEQRSNFFDKLLQDSTYGVVYSPNVLSEHYFAKVNTNIFKEILSGTSQYGPHKDDYSLWVDQKDAARFGSRGQQRSVMVWFLMQQYSYMRERTEKIPYILLDDVFSELDQRHRELLLDFFVDAQVMITGCEKEYFKSGFDEVFEVKEGVIV